MKKILLSVMMVAAMAVANAQYKVGDIYNENGVKGIVVTVTDGGAHGTIMTTDGFKGTWVADKKMKFETGAFYEDNGVKNMEQIAKYIDENNKSWADFPVFEWVRSLGDGWYIPAKDEMMEIMKSINGGTLVVDSTDDYERFNTFNHKILDVKGESMINIGQVRWMYTSTEAEGGRVHVMYFKKKGMSDKGEFATLPNTKTSKTLIFSRAFHKF